jgi:prepilin-type N-terminal cleavage/methylation domain-containing protein
MKYSKFKISGDNNGFTLLEVIISLFIITMMAGLFLANYHSTSQNTDLAFAAQQAASELREAQNNSLGSVPYGGSLPAGGWGIHFIKQSNTYLLFADANNNKLYDSSPTESDTAKGGRVFVLPANVVVDDIQAGGASRNVLDITFLPPDPVARIYWDAISSSTTAIITLKQNNSGKTANINVNILGMIEAQ